MNLPVTIVGGYLGAGKTTLVNHLLRNANGARLAVLVNEFGELPIDEDLIEAQDDMMISIAGGCVCCSYGNDLTLAMLDMTRMQPRPDHVILEASGVAIPGAIAAAVSLLPDYGIDGVVVLADAESIRDRADDRYMGDTIERQLLDADIVVLNKTDLVSPDHLRQTKTWLEAQPGNARILDAVSGKVEPAVLLQAAFDREWKENTPGSHATGSFRTESLVIEHVVDVEQFARELTTTMPWLIRSKGFIKATDGVMKTLQIVGHRWTISDAPDGVAAGLVVIGPSETFDLEAVKSLAAASLTEALR